MTQTPERDAEVRAQALREVRAYVASKMPQDALGADDVDIARGYFGRLILDHIDGLLASTPPKPHEVVPPRVPQVGDVRAAGADGPANLGLMPGAELVVAKPCYRCTRGVFTIHVEGELFTDGTLTFIRSGEGPVNSVRKMCCSDAGVFVEMADGSMWWHRFDWLANQWAPVTPPGGSADPPPDPAAQTAPVSKP